MTEPTDFLRLAPFNLDAQAIAWVSRTAAGLTGDARLMQLFVLGLHGPAEHWADDKIKSRQPGGVMRFFSADGAAEASLLDQLQDGADIPYLVSADLEGSRMSLAFGTTMPNPLALAAVNDVALTADISRLMAEEARAVGVNWSYTPCSISMPPSARPLWQHGAMAPISTASKAMPWPRHPPSSKRALLPA